MKAEMNRSKINLFVQQRGRGIKEQVSKGQGVISIPPGVQNQGNHNKVGRTPDGQPKNPQAESFSPSKEGAYLLQFLREEMERIREQGKKNPLDDDIKAMRIAHNIMAGKKVPPQDEQFLMEYNSKMYHAAKTIGSMKKQKEEVDSVLEEEEGASKELLRELDREPETPAAESEPAQEEPEEAEIT